MVSLLRSVWPFCVACFYVHGGLTQMFGVLLLSPQWTDTWNIRAKFPAEGPDAGDIWCWSTSVQGFFLSTAALFLDSTKKVLRLTLTSQQNMFDLWFICVQMFSLFFFFFKLPFRTCLGTRPSSPSHRLVLWCFRETREFIFSNGEPNVQHSPMWARDGTRLEYSQDVNRQTLCCRPFFYFFWFDKRALCAECFFMKQRVHYSWLYSHSQQSSSICLYLRSEPAAAVCTDG